MEASRRLTLINQRGFYSLGIRKQRLLYYGTAMKLARRLDRTRAALRKSRRSAVKDQIRRALRAERLEDRCLLAGDLFQSDYFNSYRPTDVDDDGTTAPGDALTIINALNAHGSR